MSYSTTFHTKTMHVQCYGKSPVMIWHGVGKYTLFFNSNSGFFDGHEFLMKKLPKDKKKNRHHKIRNRKIVKMLLDKTPYEEISDSFGVSVKKIKNIEKRHIDIINHHRFVNDL